MDSSVSLLDRLHWLGHASFRLDGPPVIYFDPWRLQGAPPEAGVVLVSHEHSDHCSPQDVERVRGPGTVVVASPAAAQKLLGELHVLRPGERMTVGQWASGTLAVIGALTILRAQAVLARSSGSAPATR